MTLNTYKPRIHCFYVTYLQYHHKISPMTGIPEGNFFFLKSHSTSPLAQPAGHMIYCNPSMSAHTTAFSPELEITN